MSNIYVFNDISPANYIVHKFHQHWHESNISKYNIDAVHVGVTLSVIVHPVALKPYRIKEDLLN